MVPHSGIGEATPSPKNPIEEILRMICPRVSVAETIIGPIPFGRICFTIIFNELHPKHLAACTYSTPRSVSTADRTTRAKRGIWLTARERIKFKRPFTFSKNFSQFLMYNKKFECNNFLPYFTLDQIFLEFDRMTMIFLLIYGLSSNFF